MESKLICPTTPSALTGPNGILFATPEGGSTHFESRLGVDTEAVLNAIRIEYGIEIVDEDDPRFWGFASWDEMKSQRASIALPTGGLLLKDQARMMWISRLAGWRPREEPACCGMSTHWITPRLMNCGISCAHSTRCTNLDTDQTLILVRQPWRSPGNGSRTEPALSWTFPGRPGPGRRTSVL